MTAASSFGFGLEMRLGGSPWRTAQRPRRRLIVLGLASTYLLSPEAPGTRLMFFQHQRRHEEITDENLQGLEALHRSNSGVLNMSAMREIAG